MNLSAQAQGWHSRRQAKRNLAYRYIHCAIARWTASLVACDHRQLFSQNSRVVCWRFIRSRCHRKTPTASGDRTGSRYFTASIHGQRSRKHQLRRYGTRGVRHTPADLGASRRGVLQQHDRSVVANAQASVVVLERPRYGRNGAKACRVLCRAAQ